MPLEVSLWEGVRQMMNLKPEYSPIIDGFTPCEGQGGVIFYTHFSKYTRK